MPEIDLQIIPGDLLEKFRKIVSEKELINAFNQLEDAELSTT